MITEVLLPQLPDFALSAIMEKLDFRSILSLRKVSRSLHSSIGKLKPDFPVTHLLLSFDFLRISNFIDIKYEVQTKGLLRTFESFENGARPREKLIEEETVSNAYSQDLANILKYRKSVLEEIYIDTYYHDSKTNISSHDNILYSVVLKVFESLYRPIRTKIIRVAVVDQKDVISILQFIDPNCLETITISNAGAEKQILKLDQLLNMDQWKKVEKINIFGFNITPADLEMFGQFKMVTVAVGEILIADLMTLKDTLLNASKFKFLKLYYEVCDLAETFKFLGEPNHSSNSGGLTFKSWRFPIPNSEEDLSMAFDSNKKIWFLRVPSSESTNL